MDGIAFVGHAPMPSPGKDRHCQVTVGSDIMVFGGSSTAVYRLDVMNDTWSTWRPTAQSHSAGACGVIFGAQDGMPERVVVAGGFSGNSVEILTLATRQWAAGMQIWLLKKLKICF